MTDDEDQAHPPSPRDAAIEWWVSSRAGFSPEERAAFEAWFAADPAHRAAYDDIVQTFEQVRQVRGSRPARPVPRMSRRGKLAAGAVLAAACLALFVFSGTLPTFLRADFSTGTGETKTVTLDDGSRVELAPRSAIAARLDAAGRHVTLLAGEAWFEVAREPARPFVVEAGGGTITALGTAFDVALDGTFVRVAVGQHKVRVASRGENVVVAEHQQATYDAHAPPTHPSPAPRSLAAWRRGKLIFEDQPLGEVLAALARYRHGLVACVTAATCARPVTGVFSTDKPLQALREIELFLGLRAVHLTDYLVLLYE